MGIFETLRIEHAAIQDLLDDLIDATTVPMEGERPVIHHADWVECVRELKQTLIAHDRAEEAVFYDLLRSAANRSELADVKTEEHHIVEELIENLERLQPRDGNWPVQLALLKSQIESHIAEEEANVFGIVQPFVDDEHSERLAVEFEKLRDETAPNVRFYPRENRRRTEARSLRTT